MIPSLNKWDIWLAKVAFEDEPNIIKNRPVLIIDNTKCLVLSLKITSHAYTTIESFYKLKKIVENDPKFDKKRAQKKLRAFVESNEYTISKKAAMMVEHFHEQVIAKGKIGGQARAMVLTASIARCLEYYYAISKCLSDRHSPYKAIVAFTGEYKYH